MIELPVDLPAELVPLSWLLGVWEGSGVIDYKIGDESVTHEFGQRVSFSHDGLPHLNYTSYTWLFPAERGGDPEPARDRDRLLAARTRAGRRRPGPGAPARRSASRAIATPSRSRQLRNADGGFDLEVSLVHPGGVSELYLGQVKGPRIDLATDAVMRTASAKDYAAATRLYGLVEGHLLWAWDIAALGQDLRTHASARLAKVD